MNKLYCEDLIRFSDAMSDFNRVLIITELMNGRALSASWLANRLNLSPQATRFHLKKLEDVELIHHRACGKHRYYEIKNQDTAMFIESTFKVIPPKEDLFLTNANTKEKFKEARTCYKHLAGSWSVALTQSFIDNKFIVIQNNFFVVTENGKNFFNEHKLLVNMLNTASIGKRCIDFSEHRDHIGGPLGTLLLQSMLQQEWFVQNNNNRELTITSKGRKKLKSIIN
ncbi:DNA-binding transcriptional ArsR family regulator [Frischella perrara]|uniref:Putative transcriptional regulator n=1 Tax=Frischella perrara TaxID=1267021 RepID=A0A0A7S6I8_FRIPE|nr:winged helix-turn-helix domain-containing protein [Frischella perrara]AJA44871.1 putative transcriptional regulator [Frischella perrara]PWV59419.1 DNA-binding transcriptional ArsR family regulator [Frischella perrara]